jgi:co-chaperonin GroES (HSP10)
LLKEEREIMRAHFLAIALGLFTGTAGAYAQTPQATPASQQADKGITANSAIGEVKAIDPGANQLVVKTDAGSVVTVTVSDKTVYMRLAPGETTLKNATKIAFAEVAEGDRVWARGKVSEDFKSVPAAALIVMNKADIAKKQEAERAEWRRRGILGVVSAVNPETKEITISSRSMAGTQSIIIPVAEEVDVRRYAPDSIKFSDAKPGTLAEIKVGDQLRALGERSPDGSRFTAEKVVTGSFRTVGGTVSAVDAAIGEIKVNDLQTKQPLTVVIKQDAVLRKFPAAGEMAMFGGRGPGARQGGPPTGQAGTPAQGQSGDRPQPAAGGGPGPGGFRAGGGGGMNIQEMLERLPTIALVDVKVGDTIIVSSTKGADPERLTAISLVTGADTLLNMIAARQQQPGVQSAPNPAAGLGSGIQFGIGLP